MEIISTQSLDRRETCKEGPHLLGKTEKALDETPAMSDWRGIHPSFYKACTFNRMHNFVLLLTAWEIPKEMEQSQKLG